MGEVYRTRNPKLKCDIELKVLPAADGFATDFLPTTLSGTDLIGPDWPQTPAF